MNNVVTLAEFLLMGSDCRSYHNRVDQVVIDTYKMLQHGMISRNEALATFKRKMGL